MIDNLRVWRTGPWFTTLTATTAVVAGFGGVLFLFVAAAGHESALGGALGLLFLAGSLNAPTAAHRGGSARGARAAGCAWKTQPAVQFTPGSAPVRSRS